MSSPETERILQEAYYDESGSGALGGVERLLSAVREKGLKREQVRSFLASQDAYTLHRQARRHYPRKKTVVRGVDAQWQADLVDMSSVSNQNKGYRYILTVIDCFSRYAWSVPVKNKSGEAMRMAMEMLFSRHTHGRKPKSLQTDHGREFYNSQVRELLDSKGVKLFSTNSETKASIIERFNRTLKQRMWTYFTAHNTRHFLGILQALVHGYNTSTHRALGMSPIRASSRANEEGLWRHQYAKYFAGQGAASKNKLAPTAGDEVRISKQKAVFDKGYLPNWTREVFRVHGREDRPVRRIYKLKDAGGETVEGVFYPEEVQRISPTLSDPSRVYIIERVIRKLRVGKKDEEWYVKWLGWPEKFNSWIPAREARQTK